MKRTPLKRKTWLRRSGRAKPSKTAWASRPRDLEYMAWIRKQPCAAAVMFRLQGIVAPCAGRVEADHTGPHPMGRKTEDRSCVPMCQHHHRQRDNYHGPFKTWDRERMRGWHAELVVHYQRLYGART